MATDAYLSIKETINRNIEIQEYKADGGWIGRISIGLLAIGVGIFGLLALDRIFYILFVVGFTMLLSGIINIFKNPTKK